MKRKCLPIFAFSLLFFSYLLGEKQEAVAYTIVDLGEISLQNEHPYPSELPTPFYPRINNNNQVVGNRKQGGFLWEHNQGAQSSQIAHVKIQFHALNSKGDLLASLTNAEGAVEWAKWPNGLLTGDTRKTIHSSLEIGTKEMLCLCDISDEGQVSGYVIDDDRQAHIVYLGENNTLYYPKDPQSKEKVSGIYQGMNLKGTVYGMLEENKEVKPAIWTAEKGLKGLKNYRAKVVPEGDVKLESMAMTGDGVVYATYWVEVKNKDLEAAPKIYYNFAWKPETDEFKLIDIDGMRISKVNHAHTLIGTLNGKPALCEGGKKPVELGSLLSPDQSKEWEIIQISDINDSNHLVGIGKFQGNIHLFFAERQ